MTFVVRSPSADDRDRVVDSFVHCPANHPLLEAADLDRPPEGFRHDRWGAVLGQGARTWMAARAAFDSWAMYPKGWTSVLAAPGPPAQGSVYVSVIRHFGFASLLPCRVRETFDTAGPLRRYGFAFVTIAGHAEQGVERFSVNWDDSAGNADVGEVRYDVASFSRPAGFTRLAAPVARTLQLRFQRDSVVNVRSSVAAAEAVARPDERA